MRKLFTSLTAALLALAIPTLALAEGGADALPEASGFIAIGAGIAIGMIMGMGGAWIATVVALAGLAIFIQLLIFLIGLAF